MYVGNQNFEMVVRRSTEDPREARGGGIADGSIDRPDKQGGILWLWRGREADRPDDGPHSGDDPMDARAAWAEHWPIAPEGQQKLPKKTLPKSTSNRPESQRISTIDWRKATLLSIKLATYINV